MQSSTSTLELSLHPTLYHISKNKFSYQIENWNLSLRKNLSLTGGIYLQPTSRKNSNQNLLFRSSKTKSSFIR